MMRLNPLEEALFRVWARAHSVEDPDAPDNQFDYRALYKNSNGMIHSPGQVTQMAGDYNAMMAPPEGGEMPMDPLAAQVEMARVQADSSAKARSDQLKMAMKKMELEHKSIEAEKDRQHKSALAQMQAEQKAQQAQVQAQQRAVQAQEQNMMRAQMAEKQNAMRAQQMQVSEANKMKMAQEANQNKAQSGLMQELIRRQTGPAQAGGPMD